ncbi:MAG: hypothetical protein DBY32_09100 [Phascolarctobacterium sp.]|nr:MAG: hypothetical protein DBY32_09100 [Phascolarctobacterium sp.]
MKLGKKITLLIIAGLFVSLPVASAKWRPIKPGDHVFDVTRFVDSVKETAEMIKNVSNSLQKLKNQGIFNTGTNLSQLIGRYNEAAESMNDLLNGASIINVHKDYEDFKTYKAHDVSDALEDFGDYESEILKEAKQRKAEIILAEADLANRNYTRNDAVRAMLESEDTGNLTERQKNNVAAIIQAANNIDMVRAEATNIADSLQSREEAYALNRMEQEKAKAGAFYSYDPYNPTQFDEVVNTSSSENFGFRKF